MSEQTIDTKINEPILDLVQEAIAYKRCSVNYDSQRWAEFRSYYKDKFGINEKEFEGYKNNIGGDKKMDRKIAAKLFEDNRNASKKELTEIIAKELYNKRTSVSWDEAKWDAYKAELNKMGVQTLNYIGNQEHDNKEDFYAAEKIVNNYLESKKAQFPAVASREVPLAAKLEKQPEKDKPEDYALPVQANSAEKPTSEDFARAEKNRYNTAEREAENQPAEPSGLLPEGKERSTFLDDLPVTQPTAQQPSKWYSRAWSAVTQNAKELGYAALIFTAAGLGMFAYSQCTERENLQSRNKTFQTENKRLAIENTRLETTVQNYHHKEKKAVEKKKPQQIQLTPNEKLIYGLFSDRNSDEFRTSKENINKLYSSELESLNSAENVSLRIYSERINKIINSDLPEKNKQVAIAFWDYNSLLDNFARELEIKGADKPKVKKMRANAEKRGLIEILKQLNQR
jgi:regulator of replication initiation timing